ncbi:MAG TPA: hypothetical protein VIG24_07460, partial [Acidimicrobiia bacterium]
LAAFLKLVNEELVTHNEPARTAKPTRRRAERTAFRRGEPGTVQIIHLRKTRPDSDTREETGTGRKLTTRHLRRGHWAHRRCKCHPPVDEEGYGRHLTWVRPTIVGPDDAPLVAPDRVYQVDR